MLHKGKHLKDWVLSHGSSTRSPESSLWDKHILQYQCPGEKGECELVIGLDFGTAASKVVIQAYDLPGSPAYAVDFSPHGQSSMPFLLPTKIWVGPDGYFSLHEGTNATPVHDIKLELFFKDRSMYSACGPERRNLLPEVAAAAYLSLLLRYSRKWILKEQYDVLRHLKKLTWSMNLGVPSPCIDNWDESERFRLIGKTAWVLSLIEGQISPKTVENTMDAIEKNPEIWRGAESNIQCGFDIVPEIAAGAVGYASSTLRREGVHLIIDVGASTVDVCTFLLHQRDGNDRYALLTADVRPFGTIRLHHKRVCAAQQRYAILEQDLRHTHNPIAPIANDYEEYLLSPEEIKLSIEDSERELGKACSRMLWKAIVDLKRNRAPNEDIWEKKQRLPVLIIGGGSKLRFYNSVVQNLNSWFDEQFGLPGVDIVPLPIPNSLKSETTEYHRLAVAWGLSHPNLNIGEIIPLKTIKDIEPPRKRDYENRFISKDQV